MEKYVGMYRLYKEKEGLISAQFIIYVIYEEIRINGKKKFHLSSLLAPLIP